MDELNTELVAKTLSYHGLPLQKAWEEERGSTDLKKLGLTNVDYSEYFARQKSLSFSDRTKRLRLHQFICKKASVLFDGNLSESFSSHIYKEKQPTGAYAITPPFEVFGNLDLTKRTIHFFENGQPGDVVYGIVISKANYGIIIKLLCSTGSSSRYLTDLNIKAAVSSVNLTGAIDKKNITRGYMVGDNVCCEVLEIYRDTNKLVCGMRGIYDRFDDGPAYGLVTLDELPAFYKVCLERIEKEELAFNDILHGSNNFKNPACIENLMLECGLDPKEHYTNMSSLRGRFPQDEYANELRQAQASKWAFRSVAEGIEHFKESRHTEAFQCLNKALSIDPRNVEGLVARGALYANSGSFKKAVADFEFALQLNPSHSNARKYLGETLVALGRSFEEEGKNDEARKAYVDCLKIIPTHEEAKSSLDYLKSKTSGGIKMIVKPDELQLPPLNLNDSNSSKMMHGDHDAKKDDSRKEKKSKKDKKKRNKKRHSSSSGSSSESTNSSESSSESSAESSDSSSSSDSNSNSRQKKKSKKKDKTEHQKSLSPLSKRLGDVGNVGDPSSSFQFNQFDPQSSHHFSNVDDYEMKVRKFIEMPRDEEDYEEKVRQFVAQASKYQKERKHLEDKSIKKKKKKEDRKMKKDSKKKRKKEEKRQKKSSRKEKIDLDSIESKKIRDALKLFESLPVLDELGSKLTEYYSKVDKVDEKSSIPKKKTQENLYDKDDDLGGKWKMMFSKDERTNEQISKTKQPKQYAFGYESEDDEQRASQNQAHASYGAIGVAASHLSQHQPSTSSAVGFQRSKSKGRHVSPPPKPKDVAPPSSNQVKSGPVVLDKFGNFRLANTEPLVKLPERGRSRSRKYDSSSSASRSPRRRSRSGSYGRRRSRSPYHRGSRSRSYSRSRSRSRSGGRRFNRSFRGGRGAAFNDRGNYYKPRFSGNARGRSRGGAPGNGGYRDNYRDNNFRGRGGRDRSPFRPRARGNGNRYQGPRRSRSFSVERARSQEPNSNKNFADVERDRKPKSPPIHGPVLIEGREVGEQRTERNARGSERPEDTEKVLDKARKEKKIDMLERNKDLVKKPTSSATSSW